MRFFSGIRVSSVGKGHEFQKQVSGSRGSFLRKIQLLTLHSLPFYQLFILTMKRYLYRAEMAMPALSHPGSSRTLPQSHVPQCRRIRVYWTLFPGPGLKQVSEESHMAPGQAGPLGRHSQYLVTLTRSLWGWGCRPFNRPVTQAMKTLMSLYAVKRILRRKSLMCPGSR